MAKQNSVSELGRFASNTGKGNARSLLQLVGAASSPASISSSLSSNDGSMRSGSLTGDVIPKGIQLGVPSSSGSIHSTSANWAGLLSNAAGGGIASVLGGGLSSITGLGGLVSGLLGLFGGGKSEPPPLVRFQLPAAQEANISINGSQSSAGQIYGSNLQARTSTAETKAPVQNTSSQQIVQTVKEALLNSSSLNDVIAEI